MALIQKYLELNLNPKPFYVYVLRCEGDRYYVGMTAHLTLRMAQHFQQEGKKYPGGGSTFTERYKPISLIESEYFVFWAKSVNDKPYDEETKKAEEYIRRFGSDKVYGGKYRLPYMKNIWW